MILDENNYKEKIYALTNQDWQPLFELIPTIQSTLKIGEMSGGENEHKIIIQLPYCIIEPIVSRFLEVVYNLPIIIDFDWVAWEEGRKITREEKFDFDILDLPTKCKLITAIVRNDRFCEGALVSAFESGLILKILKSIEKKISGKWGRTI